MIDFSKHLNPSQLKVVTSIDGPILVIAGAGSGKTRVIEYRVLYLVQNNISPQSILLLTFTRKAAQQMLSRAASHDLRCNHVEGGTFHSFAYRTLRKYSKQLNLGEFMIIDESDAEEAIQICANKNDSITKEKRFPKKDTLRKILSMSVNKNVDIEKILETEYPNFYEYAGIIEKIKEDYIQYKASKSYLDYDDLLIFMRNLLATREEVRLALSRKYKYIMVDEYQDTNKIQAEITCLLAKDHKNIMVVGDDAQSIYGFRGASHENILDFPKFFPGCRIMKLEENYRSVQNVLDVANAVLDNMQKKYSKYLHCVNNEKGEKPQLMFFKDINLEAEWIANKIQENRESGVDLFRQAVLFRSAYISIPLQMELSRRGIPYQVFGGMKFYETAHVKDLLAHLKIIINLQDELSWNRVLTLIDGIGPKNARRIIENINKTRDFESVRQVFSEEINKRSKFSASLIKLITMLEEACSDQITLRRKMDKVWEYYYSIFKEKFDDWFERINDIESLIQIFHGYESVHDFLADFALEPPEKGVSEVLAEKKDDERPVTLSTIHSAKGLEWECVFLIGLIEGVLPVSFSLDDEMRVEEEKRLFYVALTRAKSKLFLCVHHEGIGIGISQFNKISRFLDDANVLSCLKQEIQYDYDV